MPSFTFLISPHSLTASWPSWFKSLATETLAECSNSLTSTCEMALDLYNACSQIFSPTLAIKIVVIYDESTTALSVNPLTHYTTVLIYLQYFTIMYCHFRPMPIIEASPTNHLSCWSIQQWHTIRHLSLPHEFTHAIKHPAFNPHPLNFLWVNFWSHFYCFSSAVAFFAYCQLQKSVCSSAC